MFRSGAQIFQMRPCMRRCSQSLHQCEPRVLLVLPPLMFVTSSENLSRRNLFPFPTVHCACVTTQDVGLRGHHLISSVRRKYLELVQFGARSIDISQIDSTNV